MTLKNARMEWAQRGGTIRPLSDGVNKSHFKISPLPAKTRALIFSLAIAEKTTQCAPSSKKGNTGAPKDKLTRINPILKYLQQRS